MTVNSNKGETMKIGKILPIYSANVFGKIEINCVVTERVINFTGYSFSEARYKLMANLLQNGAFQELVVTDSDRISYDDLITKLKKKHTVLIFFNDMKEENHCSKKRVQKAVAKLKKIGVKVVYRASVESANSWLEKNGYETMTPRNSLAESQVKTVRWKNTHLSVVA